jgi:lipoprotein-anchoring transpeptidase ErfK/SrfK
MDTDVVTGLPTSERETRRGIYAIDAKKEHATLGRLDVQGYASPVDYWAPFDGGRGLHDAPWRSSFGGDIYLSDGSHGCVNIPSQNMAAIYNAIEIGNAVIIY